MDKQEILNQIKMTCEDLGFSNRWGHKMNHWRIDMVYKGRVRKFDYFMGEGWNGQEPSLDMVMECLVNDAWTYENYGLEGVQQFCDDMGYDSRKLGRETLDSCRILHEKLTYLFGDEFENVRELFEGGL